MAADAPAISSASPAKLSAVDGVFAKFYFLRDAKAGSVHAGHLFDSVGAQFTEHFFTAKDAKQLNISNGAKLACYYFLSPYPLSRSGKSSLRERGKRP
jgi:hypothetical protein